MPDIAPIPVTTGFTWTAALMALANVLIGGLLVAIVRTWPALKKIGADREANLLNERAEEMQGMRTRIADLEAKVERMGEEHAAEIKRIEKEREAERAIARHEIGNLNQALQTFISLIELNPERAAQAAARVKEQLAADAMKLAAEKGAMAGARIKDTGAKE